MVGSTRKTRAAGFNGIAVIIWAEDALTMSDKSNAGAPSAATLPNSGKTVRPAPSIAGQSKGRLCFTGRMTRGSFSQKLVEHRDAVFVCGEWLASMTSLPPQKLTSWLGSFRHTTFLPRLLAPLERLGVWKITKSSALSTSAAPTI